MKKIYYSNGQVSVDTEAGAQCVNGLTLAIFSVNEEGTIIGGQYREDGEFYPGYKATELSENEAAIWATRIRLAGELLDNGYKDSGGWWYPGMLGAGRSVINKEAQKKKMSLRDEANEAQLVEYAKTFLPAFERAAKIAVLSGGTAIDVLKDFRPDIPKEVFGKLLELGDGGSIK